MTSHWTIEFAINFILALIKLRRLTAKTVHQTKNKANKTNQKNTIL